MTATPAPGPRTVVVGIIGGGQLARMMYEASIGLGVDVRMLAEGPDVSAAGTVTGLHATPAGRPSAETVTSPV